MSETINTPISQRANTIPPIRLLELNGGPITGIAGSCNKKLRAALIGVHASTAGANEAIAWDMVTPINPPMIKIPKRVRRVISVMPKDIKVIATRKKIPLKSG